MRASKEIRPKSRRNFAIIVEGQCENWYIQMLKRNERSLAINLEPKLPQRKKLSDLYKLAVDLSEDYQKVLWIIDFDVIINGTRAAKSGSITPMEEFKKYYLNIRDNYKDKIIIIINNPCIEFWFLLHFERTARYFNECDKVITELKKYIKGYDKTQDFYTRINQDIYLKLKSTLTTAIGNAKSLPTFNITNPHNGMSQMQLFFDELKIP